MVSVNGEANVVVEPAIVIDELGRFHLFTARAPNAYVVPDINPDNANVVAYPADDWSVLKSPVLIDNNVPAGLVFNPNVTVMLVENVW